MKTDTRKITGTREWSQHSLNIAAGCEHNCRYCYARHNMVERFGRIKAEDWPKIRVDQKRVDATYGHREGVTMFPTAHDITPAIINEYCCVLRKLLDAGNQVLIVTKPHWECITLICEGFKEYRDKIMFRFTIGSTMDEVLAFWEPGAPNFDERFACLQYAYYDDYQTSVSCEPYLDGYVGHLFEVCKPFITDSFWVGKLNQFRNRVRLDDVTTEQMQRYVEPLRRLQSDLVVKGIYEMMKNEPLVRWKDSI